MTLSKAQEIEFDPKVLTDEMEPHRSRHIKDYFDMINGSSSSSSNLIEESHSFPSLDQSCISLDTISLEPHPSSLTPLQDISFTDDANEYDDEQTFQTATDFFPKFDDSVMSVDPLYSFSAEELQSKVQRSPSRCSCDDFLTLSVVWVRSRLFPSWTTSDGDDFSYKH